MKKVVWNICNRFNDDNKISNQKLTLDYIWNLIKATDDFQSKFTQKNEVIKVLIEFHDAGKMLFDPDTEEVTVL